MTPDEVFPWFLLVSVVLMMLWLGLAVAFPVATDIYDALGAIR